MITTKNYQHYILSKFNLPSGKSHKKPHQKWINMYYRLFDAYCYPSVIKQTHKNFRWLIAFDETTIDKAWVESHKKIIPLYINDFSKSFKQHCREYIRSHCENVVKYLITTRLDVDDSLHEDFIKTVHIDLKNHDSNYLVVSLVHGLTRNVKTNKSKEWTMYYANPFITLLEKLDDSVGIQTVRCCKHVRMMKVNRFDLSYVNTKVPMWIQNIHGWNASNVMRGKAVKIDLSSYHVKDRYLNKKKRKV